MRRAAFLTALFLSVAIPAGAQNFDVFERSDFVDPRLHGAVFNETGFELVWPGSTFYVLRGYAGAISDYRWRQQQTSENLRFVHLSSNYYRGATQWTVQFTEFEGLARASELPQRRAVVRWSRYGMPPDPPPGVHRRDQEPRYAPALFDGAFRYQVMLGVEERTIAGERRFDYTIGAGTDFSSGEKFVGTLAYYYQALPGRLDRQQVGYFYELFEADFGFIRFAPTVSYTAERVTDWHFGSVRPTLTATIPIRNVNLRVAVQPEFSRRVVNQVAFYVDSTIFSRLIAAPAE